MTLPEAILGSVAVICLTVFFIFYMLSGDGKETPTKEENPNTTEHDKKIAEDAVRGFVKKLNPYLFKNCKLKRTDDAIEDICSFMDKHLSSRGDKGEQI